MTLMLDLTFSDFLFTSMTGPVADKHRCYFSTAI